jgi:uncharacterized protein (TIRG00374 family)
MAVKALASAGLLYWVLRGTDLGEVTRALAAANVSLLVVAFGMCFVGYFLSVTRWGVLLSAQGVPVRKRKLVHTYLVAMFFNNFLPSTIGGDAYRAYESWRWGSSKSGALAVVFVDRFLGLVALVLFALGASAVWQGISGVVRLPTWTIALAAAGMVGVVWAIFFTPALTLGRQLERTGLPGSKFVAGIVGRVKDAFQDFRGRRDALAKAMFLSLALQTNVVLYYYVMARALGFDVGLPPFFLIIPLSIFAMLIPISINGIGIRENAFAFFFALFGVAKAESVALAFVDYGLLLLQGAVGAIAYALRE